VRHDPGAAAARRARRAGVLLGAALALSAAAPAWAQEAPGSAAAAGDRAVRLGKQGLEAYEAGRWAEAHGRFAEAQSLSPSPVFVLYMARCQRKAGKLLDARARYREVVASPVDAAAPEAWSRARADARNELAVVEPLVPWLEIGVQGASDAEVLVDGARVAPGRVEVDPGKHRVSARVGARRVERTVEVAEGDTGHPVVLDLTAPSPGGRRPPQAAPARGDGPLWPAAAAFAAGGAAVALGSVTGAMAMSMSSAAREDCAGNQCPLAQADTIEADVGKAQDLERVSIVSFIVAGAAVTGGVVLLLTRPGRTTTRVEAHLAPGRASLRGYF
jgi:hypothetical protein